MLAERDAAERGAQRAESQSDGGRDVVVQSVVRLDSETGGTRDRRQGAREPSADRGALCMSCDQRNHEKHSLTDMIFKDPKSANLNRKHKEHGRPPHDSVNAHSDVAVPRPRPRSGPPSVCVS